MINTIVQIILSVFLISIMAFICYSIYNNEIIRNIKINSTTKMKTEIFSGIMDYTEQKNIMVETYDASSKYFLDINPSINQNGGAEYSYNFWLFFDFHDTQGVIATNVDSSLDKYKRYAYIVLFYKGETNNLPLLTNGYQCDFKDDEMVSVKYLDENINIKNPLVKIRNDGKEIIVEYNNINFPETYNTSATKFSCIDKSNETLAKRHLNKFGIKNIDTNKLRQTFNMVTVVFQEKPKNELIFNVESANCRVYFNGSLIEDRIAQTSAIEHDNKFNNIKSRVMKSNLSKLLINPINVTPGIKSIDPITTDFANEKQITISPLQVSDLSYFNYALTQKEILLLYNKGYTNKKVSFKSGLRDLIPKGTFYKIDKDEYVKPI